MSSRLSERVCIITGTGGSIGREAARTFAREGAMVVGCDLTVDAAQATVEMVRAAEGTMVSLQPCHLTKPADCQALVDFAVSTFGRIDVLFNNAAMAYFNWIEDISDDEWDRDRREEVDLVFYLTRAAWPHLKTSRGVVVNTGSLNGLLSFKTLPSLAHTTAKAGVIAIDAAARDGGARVWDSRQLDLARPDRDEPDARAAEGPRVGSCDARQDVARPSWPARGGGERRYVFGLGREFVRDWRRHRRRWRYESLVIYV